MKKLLLVVGFIFIGMVILMGMVGISSAHDAVLLEWDTPTTNDDGTPISDFLDANGFANYIIKYGPSSKVYDTELQASIHSINPQTSLLIPGLIAGKTYCFTIQPVNQKGKTAPGWSPEACATLDIQPSSIMVIKATKAYSK